MYHAVSQAPPLIFLFQVVDMCAVMFWRLVSQYPCFSSDSSQLMAVLRRVKERVVKVCNKGGGWFQNTLLLNCKPNTYLSLSVPVSVSHTYNAN